MTTQLLYYTVYESLAAFQIPDSSVQNKGIIPTAMDIQELTKAMHDFVESKGWYETGSRRPQTPRNIAISLSLESAEILEHFQWSEQSANPEELSGELADVALYLLQLSSILGIDLEQAILQKLSINQGRTWDQDKNLE
jgi:NTP pyrophosphatase (non-canonical NTP hydrolase)